MIAFSLMICTFTIGLIAGYLSQREQVHRYRIQRDRALRRQQHHVLNECDRSFDRALLRLEGDLP